MLRNAGEFTPNVGSEIDQEGIFALPSENLRQGRGEIRGRRSQKKLCVVRHGYDLTATATAEYTTPPSLNDIYLQEETANGNDPYSGDISNESTRLTWVTFLDELTRPTLRFI